ncbi:MAG TPA: GH116 family glycosyl-hydrolase [Planctomycetota bacterium]|nr:GH116 family glycosyl-hydrolase [Planctomycetota bacterium]HRR79687.1 GH116 family glycosyl-hydrolase [Planctomycetota bacterium]HRT96208.1 GH116 family glycosyl-hydrolase [Planctomycetota bacterium]
MAAKPSKSWPALTSYDAAHLSRIALPLGGIGTGTVSLGGRGDLRDWEIVNRPAKGFSPRNAFFALWAKPAGRASVPRVRCLEGLLPPEAYEGGFGCPQPNHGLPRFRRCSFHAAYPLGQVLLSDPDVPLDVRLEAFNPLIPGDPDRSGLPVAVLRFVLTNRTRQAVDAAVCGSLQNFIGADGSNGKPLKNVNAFRTQGKLQGIFMASEGVEPAAEQWGTIALATLGASESRFVVRPSGRTGYGLKPVLQTVTHRTAWAKRTWGDSLLDFWDDFAADGQLDPRDPEGVDDPTASLAVRLRVPPRAAQAVTFFLAWHFPNRMTWTPAKDVSSAGFSPSPGCCNPNRIGNYYTTQFADAWDAASKAAAALPRLEGDTVAFVRAFCSSDLPHAVKEAALCTLTALRSQTSFRTEDGRFFGWEGCGDKNGCCHGSCTHVWNYEHATALLFPTLARSMRETEFLLATDDAGLMSFRVNLPLARAREFQHAAADGQLGCLMKVYRDWQLSGDDAWLRTLWPKIRKAMEFCWVPGGWDADRDGVIEGCQHNTMDVEYYGPNPQMGGWYLGALRAVEEMARHLGEGDFADTCRGLFERGRRWMDEHLFNSEYYEHEVRPPKDAAAIAPGLSVGMGAKDLAEPELQLGAGCLVDQLVGQYTAHVIGLGYLLDPRHVKATHRAIFRHNFRRGLHGHFNHLRTFALNDESALLMATYLRGRRPKRPFPYYNEVMTGFEYCAAVGMLYEGQTAAGLQCIEAIRARYDGRKRNPFDEAECGHHYARAMAAWSAVPALTGFHYSAVTGTLTFAPAREPTTWFWSTGAAWGTVRQKPARRGIEVQLSVLHGKLEVRKLALRGFAPLQVPHARPIAEGRTATFHVRVIPGEAPRGRGISLARPATSR